LDQYFDHPVYERILVDLPVDGETRKAVVTTGKLGIVEALDRTNGQWLWHKETVPRQSIPRPARRPSTSPRFRISARQR
jgi:glucose dehydrogenase